VLSESIGYRKLMMKKSFAISMFSLCLASHALADGDQYRARAALEAGEILSLAAILDAVSARVIGVPIEIELERDDGLWVYELEIRSPNGRIVELEVDATDGTILEMESYED
jgi:uncharacterized membrane protein YkoI